MVISISRRSYGIVSETHDSGWRGSRPRHSLVNISSLRRCDKEVGSSMQEADSRAVLEHENVDGDWRALRSPVSVVQVVEAATQALVKDVGTTKSQ